MVTFYNTFHGTSATLNKVVGSRITARAIKNLKKRLCPSKDCKCSPTTGVLNSNYALGMSAVDALRFEVEYVPGGRYGTIVKSGRES